MASFSSTLLDSIYRSIDDQLQDNNNINNNKNKNQYCPGGADVEHDELASFRRSCMIEKWMDKKSSNMILRCKSMADFDRNPRNVRDRNLVRPVLLNSTSSSSSGSSSESDVKSSTSDLPKPVRTTNKSRASRIYAELKKARQLQPVSPGGRLASFLNNMFNKKHGKFGSDNNKIGSDRKPRTKSSNELGSDNNIGNSDRKPRAKTSNKFGFDINELGSDNNLVGSDWKPRTKSSNNPGSDNNLGNSEQKPYSDNKLVGSDSKPRTKSSNKKPGSDNNLGNSEQKPFSDNNLGGSDRKPRTKSSNDPGSDNNLGNSEQKPRTNSSNNKNIISDQKPRTNTSSSTSASSTCSSSSSYSRSCLSKTQSSNKRSVRFVDDDVVVVTEELVKFKRDLEEKRRVHEAALELLKNYRKNQTDILNFHEQELEDDDDDASCASSDLFELDNLSVIGIDHRYEEELPVYETTHLGKNRAIANGLVII